MCGVGEQPAAAMCDAAREEGLLVITAGKGDIIRLVPPLIISNDDVDEAVGILVKVINQHAKEVSNNNN
jgi:acetylornithine aminotransferase